MNGVQYALLEQKAYIAPIRIQNSGAVQMKAVVYNSVTQEYYTLSRDKGLTYAADNDGTWTLQLPTYETKNGQQRVDGVWQLVCLKLSNCYDGTDKVVLRDAANPIVWLGTTSEAESYKAKNGLTADKTFDFSPLSTEVISTVQVNMEPGTTALGGKTAAFMTPHKVAKLGIAVTLCDYANRPIPAGKLTGATLHISYTAPNTDEYGYAVRKDANRTYDIPLQRGEDGRWTVDAAQTGESGYIWQYVGAYKVTSLELTVPKAAGATTKNFVPNAPDTTGIPTQYTVTSAAPSLDAVKIIEAKNTAQFGKDEGGKVNGSFLAAYDPGASVKLELETKDAAGYQYALVPELAVKLELTHQGGSEANGGYTWKGTTGFERHTVTLRQSGENTYISPAEQSLTLLAGSYQVKGTLTARGSKPKDIEGLKTVQVYSVSPTLTVTGISPSRTVQINPAGDIWSVPKDTLLSAVPYRGEDYAVVYMGYKVNDEYSAGWYTPKGGASIPTGEHREKYARYTVPKVELAISNLGANYPATLTLTGDCGTMAHEFAAGNLKWEALIGTIIEGEDHSFKLKLVNETVDVYHKTQKVGGLFGTHTVEAVTTTVGEATFTRALTKPVTISQPKTPVTAQKLTYTAPAGVTVAVTADGTIPNGGTVYPLKQVTVKLTATEGYCKPRLSQPKGVYHWTVVSETADRAEYTFNMPFAPVNIDGVSISENPRIYFQESTENVNITVKYDVNEKPVESSDLIEPGTKLQVSLTGKEPYFEPRFEAPPAGVEWEKHSATGNSKHSYTFTMPAEDVTLPAPTATRYYQLKEGTLDGVRLEITQKTTTGSIAAVTPGSSYIQPNNLVTVKITAVNGTDPVLTVAPAAITVTAGETAAGASSRTYTFHMPREDVTLSGTMTPKKAPAVEYDNTTSAPAFITTVSYVSDGESSTVDISIKPKNISPVNVKVPTGSTVTITAKARQGYYEPRIKETVYGGVTLSGPLVADMSDAKSYYGTVQYTFTMPEGNVNLTGITFTAKEAPTVTVKNEHEKLLLKSSTIMYTPYVKEAWSNPNTALDKGLSLPAQPGGKVTVKLCRYDYYEEVKPPNGGDIIRKYAKIEGIAVTSADGTNISVDITHKEDARETYVTFTMGTQNITVTVPKQDP